MKQTNNFHWLITLVTVLFAGAVILATGVFVRESKSGPAEMRWQSGVSPGDLSKAHAFLDKDCAACHTANSGIDSSKCIVCHADNAALFQQQNTAFHADSKNCKICHIEHGGSDSKITRMEHKMLSKTVLSHIASMKEAEGEIGKRLERWIAAHEGLKHAHQNITAQEMALNCAACHSNQDVHRGLMGNDCAACHATTTWDIAAFIHPSMKAENCSECHRAPPSHYMMHFIMISMTVAKQPNAKVGQCYVCHQTNDWNDIKGVGWYKHH